MGNLIKSKRVISTINFRSNFFIYLLLFSLVCFSCKEEKKATKEVATVNYFKNPVLPGFYPDPSICKVGDSYYLINSTFSYFPGLPIFKSSDLVNWKQIGNVLDKPEQLNLKGLQVSEGLFAPAIEFYNDTFYITCTLVGGGGNFIVTAKDPAGPWSNPKYLPKVNGIDPSPFFNKDGKAYIVYNSDAPDQKPEYDGHRTIKIIEFNPKTLETIGEPEILVNKGSKPEEKPIWIEGPHVYNIGEYYYLMAAEGGTSDEHSEVIFRSKNVTGPYLAFENNPILTQRNLDANRENPITSVGHADLVEDENGEWWGVFLGCRPYTSEGHYNTGRETFMAPVKWENNWPVFDLGGAIVSRKYRTPNNVVQQNSDLVSFTDQFDGATLGFEWLFLRTPFTDWYSILEGKLHIETRPESISEKVNPSFIGYRQQHIFGSVSVDMDFATSKENEKAGLVAFQNEQNFYYLCKSFKNETSVVSLLQSNEIGYTEIASKELKDKNSLLNLKIVAKGEFYDFLYSENGEEFQSLKKNVDAKFLSTKEAGGFVGAIYGMYTTSLGLKTDNNAIFDNFKLESTD